MEERMNKKYGLGFTLHQKHPSESTVIIDNSKEKI
jgi:hypothetical protein